MNNKNLYLNSMMSRYKQVSSLIIILLLSHTLFGQLNFTYQTYCNNDTTFFTITNTTGIDSVLWDFDDPPSGIFNTSILFNPYHIFSAPNTYNVKLTAYSGGVIDSVINAVIILPPLVADAGPDQLINSGNQANLNGSASGGSGGPYTYYWSPPALLVNPNTQNPVTQPLAATTDFTLLVTDQATGCVDSSMMTVYISQGPLIVNVTANPDSICVGDSVQLNVTVTGGSGNYSYFWPALGITIPNPVVYPAVATTYLVNVTDGFSNIQSSVTINIFPPLVITSQPVNSTIFAGDNTSFQVTATGASGYQWQISINGGFTWNNLTNAPPYSGVTTNTLLITNATLLINGYQYKCIVYGPCDTLTSNVATLNVDPVPIPIIAIIDSFTVCSGDVIVPIRVKDCNDIGSISLRFLYDPAVLTYSGYQNPHPDLASGLLAVNGIGGNGAIAWFVSPPTPAVSFGTDTLLEFIFTYTGGASDLIWDTVQPGNCDFSDFYGVIHLSYYKNGYVTLFGPAPIISSQPVSDTICIGDSTSFSVTVTNDTAIHWQENTGGGWLDVINGGVYSGANSTTLNIAGAILGMNGYAYRCKVDGICVPVALSDSVVLLVKPPPNISIFPVNPSICIGDSLLLGAVGANTYTWTPSTGLSDPNVFNPMASPAVTTTYNVFGTDAWGCSNTTDVTLTVKPYPTVDAGNDTTICFGSSVNLLATGGTMYLWSPPTWLSSTIIPNPVSTPNDTIKYWVTVTESGCSSVDSVTINVNPIPIADAGPSVSICAGDSATLTATGVGTYEWSILPLQTTASINVSPIATTTYTVTVTLNGCTDTDDVTVYVLPLPSADAGLDTTICVGGSATLTASGGGTYAWSTIPPQTIASIIVSPLDTTCYYVTVTLISGCSAVDSVTVNVNPLPVTSAFPDTTICFGESVDLTATGGSSYLWSTTPPQITNVITVTPADTTNFYVTVTDLGCSSVDSVMVNVNPLPVANAGLDPTICFGDSVQLLASGGALYLWSPSTGLSAIDIPDPYAKPADTTKYFVSVTLNGCSSSDSVTVNVNPNPIADAGNDTTICFGDSVQLTAFGTPGYSFQWSTGAVTQFIIVAPADTSEYYVTVTENGCLVEDTVQINVNPRPVIFIGNDTIICDGDILTLDPGSGYTDYLWNDGSISQQFFAMYTGTYDVTVTNIYGCDDADTMDLIVNPIPVVVITPPNPYVCYGNTVLLTASGTINYIWSPANTLSSDTGSVVEAIPFINTTYTVIGTDNIGCSASDEVMVEVKTKPDVFVTMGSPVICEFESTILTGHGAISYEWWPSYGLNHINTPTVIANPPYTTHYVLTGIASNGCIDTANVTLKVHPNPRVNLGEDRYLCNGWLINLDAGPYLDSNIYLWQDGSDRQFYSATKPGVYYVKVTNEGCWSTDTIVFLSCTEIWIPNTFTPNADNINDVFKPQVSTGLTEYKLYIYTRLGELIFTSDNIEIGWDGTFKGKICPVGVYEYVVYFEGLGNVIQEEENTKRGHIFLLR